MGKVYLQKLGMGSKILKKQLFFWNFISGYCKIEG